MSLEFGENPQNGVLLESRNVAKSAHFFTEPFLCGKLQQAAKQELRAAAQPFFSKLDRGDGAAARSHDVVALLLLRRFIDQSATLRALRRRCLDLPRTRPHPPPPGSDPLSAVQGAMERRRRPDSCGVASGRTGRSRPGRRGRRRRSRRRSRLSRMHARIGQGERTTATQVFKVRTLALRSGMRGVAASRGERMRHRRREFRAQEGKRPPAQLLLPLHRDPEGHSVGQSVGRKHEDHR